MKKITKKELKKWINEIVNEVELDRTKDHLLNLKQEKSKTLNFKVDDMEYKIVINETLDEDTKEILLSVFSFVNVTAGKNIIKQPDESIEDFTHRFQQTKTGLTNTGKQMRVFNEIYNIFIKYIEKFHPKFVGYQSIEKNRQKLYKTLINRATKQSGIKFKDFNHINPLTQISSNPFEFYFEVEY